MSDCIIGDRCNIGQNVVVAPKVILGQNVKVQNNVSIYTGVICEDNVMKKKAIVFLLSDFMADDYQHNLKIASGKHDITGIRVYDKYEAEIPNLGMVQVQDQETGSSFLVNTSSKSVRKSYEDNYKNSVQYFSDSFKKSGAGALDCMVGESYVKKLLGYFKQRG